MKKIYLLMGLMSVTVLSLYGADVNMTPSTFSSQLNQISAGTTVYLEAGTYNLSNSDIVNFANAVSDKDQVTITKLSGTGEVTLHATDDYQQLLSFEGCNDLTMSHITVSNIKLQLKLCSNSTLDHIKSDYVNFNLNLIDEQSGSTYETRAKNFGKNNSIFSMWKGHANTIKNCTINYTNTQINVKAIKCYYGTNHEFRDNTIVGAIQTGIQIWSSHVNVVYNGINGYSGAKVIGGYIERKNPNTLGGEDHGIYFHNLTEALVDGVEIKGFTNTGAGGSVKVKNANTVEIRNCTLRSSGVLLRTGGSNWTHLENIWVHDNDIYDSNATNGVSFGVNIYLDPNQSYANPRAIRIENNKMYDTGLKVGSYDAGSFNETVTVGGANQAGGLYGNGYASGKEFVVGSGINHSGNYVINQSTDTQAPSIPAGLNSTDVTPNSLTLSWSASTDNVGVTGYDIYQNGSVIKQSHTTTSYAIAGLAAETQYTYTVKAKDAENNISLASTDYNVSTLANTTGEVLTVTSPANNANFDSGSTISVTTAVTGSFQYVSVKVDGVWKAQDSNAPYAFSLSGIADGSHTIQVYGKMEDNSWVNAQPVNISIGTQTDNVVPSTPTNLESSNVTQNSLTLSWSESTDNVGVTGYDIYQNGSVIKQSHTSTSYAITGLAAETVYSFTVKAKDAEGNESQTSSAHSVTTLANVSDGIITITSPANGASVESGAAIHVTASVTGEFQYLAIKVDGVWQAQDATLPYAFDLSGVSDGAHTIKVYGKKSDGSWGIDDEISITVQATNTIVIETYEAESAVLSAVDTKSNYSGFSGTGYADYQSTTPAYIEWTINATSAESAELKFQYANGTSNDRGLEISVNGTVISNRLSFPPTGGWATWQYTASVTANLNEGNNTIRATAKDNYGANIDYLEVTFGITSARTQEGVVADVPKNKMNVVLYPNPARMGQVLKFNMEGSNRLQSGQVRLYSLMGNLVLEEPLENNNIHSLRLPSHLDAGTYIFSVQSNDLLLNRRIVISE